MRGVSIEVDRGALAPIVLVLTVVDTLEGYAYI